MKNKLINSLIIILLLFVSLFMYSKYGETRMIVVKEKRITKENIPINFNGVKIVYFSDILYGNLIDRKVIKKLINNINEYKPDLVLFGGNLIAKGNKIKDREKEEIIGFFNDIYNTLGKYAVLGNIDNDISSEILTNSNFTIMDNSSDNIYYNGITPICLIGLSSYTLGLADEVKAFENVNCTYNIVFTHESDIVDKLLNLEKKPNLILAGNTLGGEVNLPVCGPLYKMEGSKKYYLEYYNIDNTDIYISNGIGTYKYNFRLFNKPSINIFRLKSTL